jgi:calcium-dependent protein kinase
MSFVSEILNSSVAFSSLIILMGCACPNDAKPQPPPEERPSSPTESDFPVAEAGMEIHAELKSTTAFRRLKGALSSEYTISGTIGDSRAKLVYAEYLHTHQPCVIRLMPKASVRSVGLTKLKNEMHILSRMDHPHILQTYEVLEDNTHYYVVSESYIAGEFERVVKQRVSEKMAASIVEQVLSALCYCHMQGVAHRNIRLETLVLQAKPENTEGLIVKVTGFNEATFFSNEEVMNSAVGSCYFIAPEVLKRSYTEKCDIWSCGVLAYFLLSGRYPFTGANPATVFERVANAQVTFPEEHWAEVSNCAQEFVASLLQRDPADRPSALVTLSHTWISAHSHKLSPVSGQVRKSLGNMLGFQAQAALKQAVMTFIVNRIVDKKELRALRDSFKALDLNGDGQISEAELKAGLGKILPKLQAEAEAKRVLAVADGNQNGVLDYSEFIISAFPEEKLLDISNLRMAFDSFDKDASGKIALSELKDTVVVKGDKDDSEIWEQLMKQVDASGDGEVDFNEFVQMMKHALN